MERMNSAGKSWRIPRSTLRIIALGAIITLAAFLRFANLGALGEGNHYYTATVESMLQSWHNFFFAAAEPRGTVMALILNYNGIERLTGMGGGRWGGGTSGNVPHDCGE